jgi:hypothetical protein
LGVGAARGLILAESWPRCQRSFVGCPRESFPSSRIGCGIFARVDLGGGARCVKEHAMTEIPSEYRGWWRIIDTSQWVSDRLDILGPAVLSLTGGLTGCGCTACSPT